MDIYKWRKAVGSVALYMGILLRNFLFNQPIEMFVGVKWKFGFYSQESYVEADQSLGYVLLWVKIDTCNERKSGGSIV